MQPTSVDRNLPAKFELNFCFADLALILLLFLQFRIVAICGFILRRLDIRFHERKNHTQPPLQYERKVEAYGIDFFLMLFRRG
mmetsp:Transcript_975/g.2238  ORF Transcript_975/g.2238 Transcript_975/m.2238 type:complete len:83 (+) Transcript_975:2650-2898(+)